MATKTIEQKKVALPRLTIGEASVRTGLSITLIRKLVKDGELKTAPRFGTKMRKYIFESSVDALVERMNAEARQAS